MQTIRKWAVAIGLILLIIVPIMLTNYRNVYATPVVTQGAANADQALAPSGWERAGTFVEGDIIDVELDWNINWANPGGFDTVEINGTSFSVLYVEVSITDPASTVSQYELWLSYDSNRPFAQQFSYVNATLLSAGTGINNTVFFPRGFNFTYTFYAGTANFNGTYLANVTSVEGTVPDYRTYENGADAPAVLELFYTRTIFQLSQPYGSLLYVGIAIVPVGIIFVAYGLIGNRTKRRTREIPHKRAR